MNVQITSYNQKVNVLNEKINLEKLEQKTINEFLIDGITEILAGLVLLFSPLLFFYPVFVVFVPFFLFLAPQILDNIRQRTTFPRIGRVEFKEIERQEDYSVKKSLVELFLLILIAATITFVSMIIVEGKILEISQWYAWVPLMFGLIMFGPSLFLVEKTGQRYYYVFGIFSSLLGLGISTLDFPNIFDGMYLYFFTLGLLVLALGVIRYIWFIRNYPAIVLEED